MVFHCRCFSSLFEEYFKYETRTQTRSTTSYYTAGSDFNRSVPDSHAISSEILNSAEKPSNLRVFEFAELELATNNFRDAAKIGEGGFGSVYKGEIQSLGDPCYPILVAVKREKLLYKGHRQWSTEINILGVVKHTNLVTLIGYCAHDDDAYNSTQLFLVYEYMVNRSVADHLYTQGATPLTWDMRLKIAQDAACGLSYLHEEMPFRVILRDFKPSNILLDDKWNAKLGDFGLAMVPRPRQQDTKFVGTLGYAAPESISRHCYTSKSDVWSYGVFLYELITGRRPLDRNRPQNEQELLEWVKPYLESPRFQEIIDPRLESNYPLKSAKEMCIIASKCLSVNPESRPKMSEVRKMVMKLHKVSSRTTSHYENTNNDNQKDSTGIQRRLLSWPCCFKGNRDA